MSAIDRRTMLRGIFIGTLVAAAGVTSVGYIVGSTEAEAFPVAPLRAGRLDFVEEVQAVVVGPRRRRRRWVCWWHRGRRRCGWRWRWV